MYTSLVEKSPGGKIEKYVVLIEKEVPNLVLTDYFDGGTWKRPWDITKDKWSEVVAESQTGGEDKQHDKVVQLVSILMNSL